MIKIALLSYRQDIVEATPPQRARALLAEAALQGVSWVYLDPSKSKPDQKLVMARYWNGTGWSQEYQELPDVVYITGLPLLPEHIPVDEMIRQNCKIVADKGMNKLALSQALETGEAAKYLPYCAKIPTENPTGMLTEFLRKNGATVVKRTTGNKGIGLFFITPQGNDGMFEIRYDNTVFQAPLEEAAAYVAERISGRLRYRDYLAQRYINSRSDDNRAVDIRIHIQRGYGGEWAITRSYICLGGFGLLVANTNKGGFQGSLMDFLKQRKLRSADELYAELIHAAKLVSTAQDAWHPRPLCELGLDFVIDENDQIWMIESNTFPQSANHELPRATHIIGYAKWLAQQPATPDK